MSWRCFEKFELFDLNFEHLVLLCSVSRPFLNAKQGRANKFITIHFPKLLLASIWSASPFMQRHFMPHQLPALKTHQLVSTADS